MTTAYFHGTDARLGVGDVIRPGSEIGRSNYEYAEFGYDNDRVFLTSDENAAWAYAKAQTHFESTGYVYRVEPVGGVTRDPRPGGWGAATEFSAPSARVVEVMRRLVIPQASIGTPEARDEHMRLYHPGETQSHLQAHSRIVTTHDHLISGPMTRSAGLKGDLPEGLTLTVEPGTWQGVDSGKSFVLAEINGKQVGHLGWFSVATDAYAKGEILFVEVDEKYRRRGIADAMLAKAREVDPDVHHSTGLSPEGEAWSQRTAALEVKDYEGTAGDRSHITRSEQGAVPTSAVAHLLGARGEVPGEHRNKQGEQWEAFKADIAANGIQNPIFITVDPGEEPKINEGNHRRDAAVELGLPEVPVEIRYFGHAQRQTRVGSIPGWLYHVAPRSARDSIREHGLDASRGRSPWESYSWIKYPRGTYLFEDPMDAARYIQGFKVDASGTFEKDWDLWKVNPQGVEVEPDPLVEGKDTPFRGRAFYAAGPVPASKVGLMSKTATATYGQDLIARGLHVYVGIDAHDEMVPALLAGTVTARDILRLLDSSAGVWWGIMGQFGDLEDFEDYAYSDDALADTYEDLDGGEVSVVLVAKRPTRNGEPWDPEVHNPPNSLMGNSFLEDGEQIDLVEVRYNAGKGWHSAPGVNGLRVTAERRGMGGTVYRGFSVALGSRKAEWDAVDNTGKARILWDLMDKPGRGTDQGQRLRDHPGVGQHWTWNREVAVTFSGQRMGMGNMTDSDIPVIVSGPYDYSLIENDEEQMIERGLGDRDQMDPEEYQPLWESEDEVFYQEGARVKIRGIEWWDRASSRWVGLNPRGGEKRASVTAGRAFQAYPLDPVSIEVMKKTAARLGDYDREFTQFMPAEVVWGFREYDRTDGIDELGEDIVANGFSDSLVMEYNPKTNEVMLGEGNHRLAAARRKHLAFVPVRVTRRSSLRKPYPLAHQPQVSQFHDDFKPSDIFPDTWWDGGKRAVKTAMPSWRDRGTRPPAEALIAPDLGRARGNSYEVFLYDQPQGRAATLEGAKQIVEDIYGPLEWTKVEGDTEPHHDKVWGPTSMFNDAPYYLVVERLPRLGTTASTEWVRYHGTSVASAREMLRNGARAGMNLTSNPAAARQYARYASGGTAWTKDKRKQGVVLEVRVQPEETRPGEYGQDSFVSDHVVTTVPVLADRIRIAQESLGVTATLDSLNPTGGLFTEYDPQARATAPLGPNLTTLAETQGVPPSTPLRVYRGAPAGQQHIVPGDFITTNRQLAEDYSGGGRVISLDTTYGDVLDDRTEPGGEEYIYRPGARQATAADLDHWRPTKGMFAPGAKTLDPRVFDVATQVMRVDIRDSVLGALDAYWTPLYGDWRVWSRVYLAGSGASYWWDSDADMDILIGVDLTRLRQVRPANRGVADEEILAHLNRGLKEDLRPTTKTLNGFETTWFVNAGAYDILAIHPYAAYDVTADAWVVKPPVLPTNWGPDSIPEETWRRCEMAAREAQQVLALDEPERSIAGTIYFDWVHEGRRSSYSAHGGGWLDAGNVIYQYLSQHPEHLLRRLYLCKHPEEATAAEAIEVTAGAAPKVQAVVEEFLARDYVPGLHPDDARDVCDIESDKFAALLESRGIACEVVNGFKMGEFMGHQVILQGHVGVRVGDEVYDWTARQFDPSAPVPQVTSVAQWNTEWGPLKVGRTAARTIQYARNRQPSENFGSRFGQDIEPAGRYIVEGPGGPGWETGTITFQNPLEIEWGGQYGEPTNWKRVLCDRYGGKTGKALSRAIVADGYDAIITHDKYGTSEIVDLSAFSPG